MLTVLAFVVGVVVSRPLWFALVWLWHEGGVGCAFLDHDPNLASLMHGYGDGRGLCWRCRGPLLSASAAQQATPNPDAGSVVLAVDRSRSTPEQTEP